LTELIEDQDKTVIHDHAVWLPSNHAVATFAQRHGIVRVVSPRGMLGTWAMGHGRWKKRIAWWLYQRNDLNRATAFHATSELEANEIRNLGFRQPIAVVPNGLDLPQSLPTPAGLATKQFLFLSRLHRKKGLLELLAAWHDASPRKHGWKLKIAGPDAGGFRSEIERRIADLQLSGSVALVGDVSGAAKWQLIADSSFFVLPSFNENFGIAIAEALACGVPVITTKMTPWAEIAERHAGWWIDLEHSNLVNAIEEATLTPSETWHVYSNAATQIGRSYRWPETAAKLAGFYRKLIDDRAIARERIHSIEI
jgi:glycosyltransferase involved in cell wall biosynthesis